ncbi:hypothetical protein BDR26DRAFT_890442 [Obelidium mucronatum]|nr:hypothetical protein BDR26DRAFT_890442 [Obelidium mucronatum]
MSSDDAMSSTSPLLVPELPPTLDLINLDPRQCSGRCWFRAGSIDAMQLRRSLVLWPNFKPTTLLQAIQVLSTAFKPVHFKLVSAVASLDPSDNLNSVGCLLQFVSKPLGAEFKYGGLIAIGVSNGCVQVRLWWHRYNLSVQVCQCVAEIGASFPLSSGF